MARRAAVTSGEGGSPKMKNLMNAPMRMTIESWPNSSPWVNESLRMYISVSPFRLTSSKRYPGERNARGFSLVWNGGRDCHFSYAIEVRTSCEVDVK